MLVQNEETTPGNVAFPSPQNSRAVPKTATSIELASAGARGLYTFSREKVEVQSDAMAEATVSFSAEEDIQIA
eukprot:3568617-Rhodomonas_salina.3